MSTPDLSSAQFSDIAELGRMKSENIGQGLGRVSDSDMGKGYLRYQDNTVDEWDRVYRPGEQSPEHRELDRPVAEYGFDESQPIEVRLAAKPGYAHVMGEGHHRYKRSKSSWPDPCASHH
jgi:hypothetical protein